MLSVLETRPITVAGVPTAVHVRGPADRRECVVFVHGNPGPMDDWTPILEALPPTTPAVAMDLPAFGRAARPKDFDYGIGGYAAFLGALLRMLEVGRVHLVAHDIGGAWATAWAAQHPHAVASMTLVATPLLPSFRWHMWARIWQTPVVGELFQLCATPATIAAVMRRGNPRPLPEAFVDRVTGYADLAQKLRILALYRSARDPRASFGPLAEALRSLDVPACVVWGSDDPYAGVEYAAPTAALFSASELHVIERAGHWPFVDEPTHVAAIVSAFLARRTASGAA